MTALRILWQRKWLIVGCVVLFTVIAFVVTLLWPRVAPRYTAVARLGVRPLRERAFAATQPGPAEVRVAGLKAAHAEMIKRESNLLQALDTPEVKRTDWYQEDPEGALGRLKDVLTVTPARKASLISPITDRATREQDRIDLAEIANAVAQAYVDDVRPAHAGTHTDLITRLREKLEELQKRSDTIRAEIKRKKLPPMELMYQRMEAQRARIEELGAQGIELAQDRARIEATLKELEEHAKAGTLSKMPEVRAMVDEDPNIRALREKESELESMLDQLERRIHRRPKAESLITTSLAAIREHLPLAKKEAVPVQAKALREQLVLRLETATAQLLSVKAMLARIRDMRPVGLSRNLVAWLEVRAEEKAIAENIRRINDALLRLELIKATYKPVWLRAKATTPKTISSPRWIVTIPLGTLIGLVAGLALAFLLRPKTKAGKNAAAKEGLRDN